MQHNTNVKNNKPLSEAAIKKVVASMEGRMRAQAGLPPKAAEGELVLPSSVEAERRLLGAILKDNDVYDEISSFLQEKDFFDTTNRAIFEAIKQELTSKGGMKATPVLIAGKYFSSGDGINKTAFAEMEKMVAEACTTNVAINLAKMIAELSLRRDTHQLCTEGAKEALNLKNEHYVSDLVGGLEKRSDTSFVIQSMDALSAKLLSDVERMAAGEVIEESGFKSGFPSLDKIMSPFCPGNYVTLAAPTGQGKTSFGLQLAYNLARQGAPVAYFTQEMSAEHLGMSLIAMMAEVDKSKLKPGQLSPQDAENWRLATAEFNTLNLQILDQRPLTPSDILSRVRTLRRRLGTQIVILDYFGKLDMRGRYGSAQEKANEKSNQLQQIAGELGIPLIILHQLNREIYKRGDKTPQLADLRDTGAIENDSDIVLFIQRADFAISLDEPDSANVEKHMQWRDAMERAGGKSSIWLAKDRRSGSRGRITLSYNGIGKYREIDERYTPPGPLRSGFGDHMSVHNLKPKTPPAKSHRFKSKA
jgi:replicative DNA helicase